LFIANGKNIKNFPDFCWTFPFLHLEFTLKLRKNMAGSIENFGTQNWCASNGDGGRYGVAFCYYRVVNVNSSFDFNKVKNHN